MSAHRVCPLAAVRTVPVHRAALVCRGVPATVRFRVLEPDGYDPDPSTWGTCTLEDFETANAELPTLVALVRALRPGDSVVIGGGAAPAYLIERI